MGRARRKRGVEGIEEGRMKWKRSRGGEQFEGCEVFKRVKVGETDMEGNHKTEQGNGGWERGIKFEREKRMNER